jgi:hypothetical protein
LKRVNTLSDKPMTYPLLDRMSYPRFCGLTDSASIPVGPLRVEVGDRECYVGAMVFGDEVLLGAIPMEDMDLLVDPARRQVVPRDPRGPVSVAK